MNNGASFYDVRREEARYISKIDRSTANSIFGKMKDVCRQIDFASGNFYYIYHAKAKSKVDFILDIENFNEVSEDIARMNLFFDESEDVEIYRKIIMQEYPIVNCFVMQSSESQEQWLVINPHGLDKAVALQKEAANLSISVDDIVFFGDGLNDVEVIERVGCGVAMENALPLVKEKAKFVTLSNNEDGIADFLEKNILIETM